MQIIAMAFHNPRNAHHPTLTYIESLISGSYTLGIIKLGRLYISDETYKFEPTIDESKLVQGFNSLYAATSNIGKLALLDSFFSYLSNPDEILIYLGNQNREELCDAIAQRVDGLLKEIGNGERSIAASLLYSGLARCYAKMKMSMLSKAEKCAGEALEAVKNISVGDYEKLRPHLEVWFMRPDIAEELDLLRQVVYRRLSHAYLTMVNAEKAEKLAWEACRIAEELGEDGDMLRSCMLAYSINTARTGNWNTEGFRKLYNVAEKRGLIDEDLEALASWGLLISSACREFEASSYDVLKKTDTFPPLILLIDAKLFSDTEGNLNRWSLYVKHPYSIEPKR